MTKVDHALVGAMLVSLAAVPANAKDRSTVTASAETQHLSGGYGSVNSVRLEYKLEAGDTTVVFTPKAGERRTNTFDETAIGVEGTLYQKWSRTVSTRTSLAVAQDRSVFAHLDVAQDVTLAVMDQTTVTVGGRLARYYLGQDVVFASIGLRRYFAGGSVAYRLTRADPDNRDAFFAHMVDITLQDGAGSGRTKLWLSTGAASQVVSEFDRDPSAQDRGVQLQRTQPLTPRINLIALAGLSSYARSPGRITGTNFGLGVSLSSPSKSSPTSR